MDRLKIAPLFLLLGALLTGAAGAQGCRMYNRHADQHQQAEQDHQLLLQIVALINQQAAQGRK